MIREKQITAKASRYVKDTHSPSYVSDCQAAMNIAAGKAFIAGAQWADKTMLQEVLEWLEDNFFTGEQEISQYSIEVEPILKGVFSSKEQMLQSFKERFNVVDNCDQQYPSDFINDR